MLQTAIVKRNLQQISSCLKINGNTSQVVSRGIRTSSVLLDWSDRRDPWRRSKETALLIGSGLFAFIMLGLAVTWGSPPLPFGFKTR